MQWLKKGIIRDNIGQSAGWLVLIGAMEYNTIPKFIPPSKKYGSSDPEQMEPPSDWKVGAYEPTTGIHGDVEFIYTIDLVAKTLTHKHV